MQDYTQYDFWQVKFCNFSAMFSVTFQYFWFTFEFYQRRKYVYKREIDSSSDFKFLI